MKKVAILSGVLTLVGAVGCGGASSTGDADGSGGATGTGGGNSGTGGEGTGTGGNSSGTGGSSSPSGPVELTELPAVFAKVACKKAFDCCTEAERADNVFVGETQNACETTYTALYALLMGDIQEGIDKGRARYNAAAMGACMDAVNAASCTGFEDPECSSAMEPLVADGGACKLNSECIGGKCYGEDSTNDVEGACRSESGFDAPCESNSDCDSHYCDADGVCAAKTADGATCIDDDSCQSGNCDDASGTCVSSTCTL